ncbi:SRPBCC family protein [Nesterenkonia ebinurensis]|uniref:SRPBCC family protein n=1 Tax=Nesterenkonia ebinurensis TaxID=2608252 RepID=UPI00123D67F3|nr:SRPBCC family protein [Nesterenkonia ebinurensis]
MSEETKVVAASDTIDAAAAVIFELIADPAKQPAWDGNDNLAEAAEGQRITAVGQVFTMRLTSGSLRENHVVEFAEGTLIAWKPSDVGQAPAGHLWRWELEYLDAGGTEVTHTYDWSQLTDSARISRARSTTEETLTASISRLKARAEHCTRW